MIFRLLGLMLCSFIVVHLVDFETVFSSVRIIPLEIYLVALSLGLLRYLLSAWRWQILNPDPAGEFKTRDYLRFLFIGSFFNLIMPGQMGGDLIRSVYIARESKNQKLSRVFTVGVDRIVGLSSILLIGTLACLLSPHIANQRQYLIIFGIIILLFSGTCVVSVNLYFNQKITRIFSPGSLVNEKLRYLTRVWNELITSYQSESWRLAGAFGLSMGIHLAWFIVVYLLAMNLKIDMGFWSICMVTAISWLVTSLPISFGGLGVRELSFVYLLGQYGVSASTATTLSLCQFAIIVFFSLAGIPLMWWDKRQVAFR